MVGKCCGWAWLCVLGLVIACGPGGMRVEDPTPFAAASSIETTEQVILDTLPKRNWTAETVEPGRIVAFLPIRTHLLRVEIRYDAQQVTIKYVDSDNLDEKRAGADIYVHKKAVGWMRTLQKDLTVALAAATEYAPQATSGSP